MLTKWAEVISGFPKEDPKENDRLSMMGHIVFRTCDYKYKAKLRSDETEGRMNLKGMIDDPDRTTLLQKIIENNAHETASERIQREVRLLSDIHQCKGKNI